MIYPANWYWLNPISGEIYSAPAGAVVEASDPGYIAFRAAGNPPNIWPEDATGAMTPDALAAVLVAAGLPTSGLPGLSPPTQMQLLTYANNKQWALATGGYTITVNAVPLIFPSDVVSMGLITGKAARLAQPNPPASFDWQTPTGFVTIAAADFIAVATQIADFVQSTFNALAVVFAAIEAGTTTTTAEIDAAAWPSNVSTTPA